MYVVLPSWNTVMEMQLEHQDREPPKSSTFQGNQVVTTLCVCVWDGKELETQHATERELAIFKQHPTHTGPGQQQQVQQQTMILAAAWWNPNKKSS